MLYNIYCFYSKAFCLIVELYILLVNTPTVTVLHNTQKEMFVKVKPELFVCSVCFTDYDHLK